MTLYFSFQLAHIHCKCGYTIGFCMWSVYPDLAELTASQNFLHIPWIFQVDNYAICREGQFSFFNFNLISSFLISMPCIPLSYRTALSRVLECWASTHASFLTWGKHASPSHGVTPQPRVFKILFSKLRMFPSSPCFLSLLPESRTRATSVRCIFASFPALYTQACSVKVTAVFPS